MSRFNIPERMSVSVSMPCDDEGFFGRECPTCEKQFRIHGDDWQAFDGTILYCPYNGAPAPHDHFWTKEQIEYAKSVAFRTFSDRVYRELKKLEVKPDPRAFVSLGITVKHTPAPIRHLVEKSFKRELRCNRCGVRYTVFGLSYYCPFCGSRSPLEVLQENIGALREQLNLRDNLTAMVSAEHRDALDHMTERGVFEQIELDALENVVTAFETCFKQMTHLVCNPDNDESIKSELTKEIGNKYQNVSRGRKLGEEKLGIDIFASLNPQEVSFMEEMFEARHVVTHNSGIMDEKFVRKTGRPGDDVGQRISIAAKDMQELLNLMVCVGADVGRRLQLSNSVEDEGEEDSRSCDSEGEESRAH